VRTKQTPTKPPAFSIRSIQTQTPARSLAIPEALIDYADVFDNDSAAILPAYRAIDYTINLMDKKEPLYGPLYSLSARELRVLREYIAKELKSGRIRYSTSPAGAPLLFVPKLNGELRLYIDYRVLNSITIKDRYPLPLIEETLDRLTGAKFFTTLDLKDTYYRIQIREGDE